VKIDGEPWFVAADVCKALGLLNVSQATLNLTNSEVQDHRVPGTRGRANKVVTESGLYKLLFQSRKPEARAFQDWVTQVVLPAIRKDGIYLKSAKLRVLKTKGLTWERWLRDHCPISRHRADEVIAISDGRMAPDACAERQKAYRERQKEAQQSGERSPDRPGKPNDFNEGSSKPQPKPKAEPETDPVKEAEDINAKAHAQRIREE